MEKFRDMTDSEKLEIINSMIAGDPLEVSGNGGKWYDSKECNPFVVIEYYYRIPRLEAFKSFDPGTVDWTESLIWRPGYANNN